MNETKTRKDQPALAGLELTRLERMHDGKDMVFAGLLNASTYILLKRAPGVSDKGREVWSLSIANRRLPRRGTAPASEA